MVIVGIPISGKKKDLEKIVRDNGLTWPQVFDGKDGEKTVRTLYNVDGVPDHYLINRSGRIAVRHLREKDFEQEIAALFNK